MLRLRGGLRVSRGLGMADDAAMVVWRVPIVIDREWWGTRHFTVAGCIHDGDS